jgi:hypothetical protein
MQRKSKQPAPERVSIESWSAWFSMAVFLGDTSEIIGLYVSQPDDAFGVWKQCHLVPDWLEPMIQRFEDWKAKQLEGGDRSE